MRVLLVDDHGSTRQALAAGLGRLDVDVETAASAAEALDVLERRACDWLVSDIRMPGMDGVSLATRVRSERPGIRLVLMTGQQVSDDERRRIAAAGATLLTKPVTADALARCWRVPAVDAARSPGDGVDDGAGGEG